MVDVVWRDAKMLSGIVTLLLPLQGFLYPLSYQYQSSGESEERRELVVDHEEMRRTQERCNEGFKRALERYNKLSGGDSLF